MPFSSPPFDRHVTGPALKRPRSVLGISATEIVMTSVLIGFIFLLLLSLVPFCGMCRTMPRQSQSANNLKQIMLGMRIYADQNGNAFPSLTQHGGQPADPYRETLGCFELLAVFSAGEMTGKVFKSPTADVPTITRLARSDGTAWADQRMSYAFDWSAPADKIAASRVMLGDRDPDYWKGKGINVAYGDTSVRFLLCVPNHSSVGIMAQNDANTGPVVGSPLNEPMDNDNVLCVEPRDQTSAEVDLTRIGRGSSTRSGLR